MKKILHVISSPRGEVSVSIQLGKSIIEQILTKYPDSTVIERNLAEQSFPHLEESHLTSIFTPAEQRTPAQKEAIKHSDEAIKEVLGADIIVIGAPLYNFGITSVLKAWIDHIVRAGVTFNYGANGPEGLVKGKKVYLAFSAGGVYSEGPMQAYDFVVPYLTTVLGFIGMTDVSVFRIEGIKVPGVQDTAFEKGLNSILID